jgi:hypothetical protein
VMITTAVQNEENRLRCVMPNGQTIRTIAREPDVRQDRAFPENGTAVIRG